MFAILKTFTIPSADHFYFTKYYLKDIATSRSENLTTIG